MYLHTFIMLCLLSIAPCLSQHFAEINSLKIELIEKSSQQRKLTLIRNGCCALIATGLATAILYYGILNENMKASLASKIFNFKSSHQSLEDLNYSLSFLLALIVVKFSAIGIKTQFTLNDNEIMIQELKQALYDSSN